MIRFFLALITLLPLTAYSTEQHTSTSSLSGEWSVSCASGTILKVKNIESILLEVNKNQIYVKAKAKTNNHTIDIILIDPEELGLGGMRLNWSDFSREDPIAQVKEVSNKTLSFKWFGFYNKKTKTREWINEPGFTYLGSKILQPGAVRPRHTRWRQ